MAAYTVKKIYNTYGEIVEVEASSRQEAKKIAETTEGEVVHNDTLNDCIIISES